MQAKQGCVVFGVDMKIVGEDGNELPHDGKASGELMVRGPWIIASYFKGEGGSPLKDGWFPTGDVSTIDADGYMQITDRSKDVIKSGGEWIGSIDLENIAMAHPAVAMAACIAAQHPKWDERPLLVVTKKPGSEVTRDELLHFYDGKIANGGGRTTSCSSTAFHSAPPARCRRTSCARCSRTTSCRPRDAMMMLLTTGLPGYGRTLMPGVLACGVVAAAATFLSEHYGAPVMLFALLLGMAMNFLSHRGPCAAGIEFTARQLLRVGVALLGLRITFEQIAALGWHPVLLVVASVVLTIAVSVAAARLFGFKGIFGVLTGGATAICGVSAALALSAALPQHP